MTEVPRVLMITGRSDVGGGPEHLFQLAKGLGDRADVHIAAPREGVYAKRFQNLVGTDQYVPIPHRQFSLRSCYRLSSYIRQHEIDVLHSHGKAAGTYGRLLSAVLRRRCVHTFHGIHVDDYGWAMRIAYRLYEATASLSTTTAIFVSPSERVHAEDASIRLFSSVVVVPNGVPVRDGSSLRTKSVRSRPFRVLCSNRFNRQKNPELLLEIVRLAADRLSPRDIEFVVVGDGQLAASFDASVACEGLDKYVQRSPFTRDFGTLLEQSDAFLSTSRWEGLPLTILEAFAVGVPVVASDVVGNSDLVEHGTTGMLFDLDDPDGGISGLCQLADDALLREGVASAARALVAKCFSVEEMASRTLAVYESAMRGKA